MSTSTPTIDPIVRAINIGEELLAVEASYASVITPEVLAFVESIDSGDIKVNPWAEAHDKAPATVNYHVAAWRLMLLDGVTDAAACLRLAVRAHKTRGFGYSKMNAILKGDFATREAAFLAVQSAINAVANPAARAEAEAENKAAGIPAKPKPGRPAKPVIDKVLALLADATFTEADKARIVAAIKVTA